MVNGYFSKEVDVGTRLYEKLHHLRSVGTSCQVQRCLQHNDNSISTVAKVTNLLSQTGSTGSAENILMYWHLVLLEVEVLPPTPDPLPIHNTTQSVSPSHVSKQSNDNIHAVCLLTIQRHKCKTPGFRTFSCFGPPIWNSLPQGLRHCSTLSSFKAKMKTFLFSQYFHPN